MPDTVFEIIENASPRDKLIGYLQSSRKADIHLTSAEQEYMDRLDYADDIIRQHPASRDKELINMLVDKYVISVSAARNLLLDARYVHGSAAKPVKAYERRLLSDFLKGIMYKEAKDGSIKNALAAAELYARINGLDQPDEEEVEPNTGITIVRPAFTPEALGVPLPDNVDELVKQLRSTTHRHEKVLKDMEE